MAPDIYVHEITHLKSKPREKEALEYLKRVASLVKPIMRKHNWHLPVLAEFYPNNPGLLGVNINGGQKICLRLRPHFDDSAFLQEHEVVGTMLHELTHNVHGPHDQAFYKFLSTLEDEYDALQRSGYAGEGFYSKGTRVGEGVSHNLPLHLAREKALQAAEKRRQVALVLTGGGKLGGQRRSAKSPRELAAEAAERRAKDEKTCGSGAEGIREAELAEQDSIKEQVEERDSSPEIILLDGPPVASSSKKVITDAGVSKSRPRNTTQNTSLGSKRAGIALSSGSQHTSLTGEWTCDICTLTNTPIALQCDACGTTRPIKSESGWVCLFCGEGGNDHQFWSCRSCGWVKQESS
ncbi:hypothetical protein FRC02_008985 [Tulasnella sp. 418]|nr:hypothetical protein FRC02_008985 [Tulasnella sp. 418]